MQTARRAEPELVWLWWRRVAKERAVMSDALLQMAAMRHRALSPLMQCVQLVIARTHQCTHLSELGGLLTGQRLELTHFGALLV